MWIAIGVLVLLFCTVAANKEEVRESDILVKLSIFSVIVGCLGIIGEQFVSGVYIATIISAIVFVICIILGAFRMIFGVGIGFTGALIAFFTFIALVFEVLARLNNILNIGEEYVNLMINGRTMSIIIILILLFMKSFSMIFLRNNKKCSYAEIEE